MNFAKHLLTYFTLLSYHLLVPHNSFFDEQPEGVTYPQDFLKGVASSAYQNGGHHYWPSLGYRPESNWTWFENDFKARFIIDRKRQGGTSLCLNPSSPIDYGQKVGISADGWNRMFDDIALIKQLECNAYRFEIPWTDLNPQQGVWNEEAFDMFDRYIDALKGQGIEPIVTLYHWVHPKWFHDLGAWERDENIHYFVEYAAEVFKRFGHKVTYWCTINEPTVVSVCGYILGTHAPGKKDHAFMLRPFVGDYVLSQVVHNYEDAARVLANLFTAHVEIYNTLKTMEHGDTARIGIIHQMAHFKVYNHSGPMGYALNPISRLLARQFNKRFAHNIFMNFFLTGHFEYEIPNAVPYIRNDNRAPRSFDFIGLNFYSDMLFGPAPTCEPGDIMTDMTMWAIRPQSMYQAIGELSRLQKPIIITENGICDARDDRRKMWIIGYANAIKQAIDDGYDIQGYCYWSLLDNFEWNMGHSKKFGLYAVDTLSSDPQNKDRVLREGATAYRDYVHTALS